MEIYEVTESDVVHYTSVDFVARTPAKDIYIVQYDSSQPIIAVTLYRNRSEFFLPAGYEANVRFGKRDRTYIYKPVLGCSSDRNTLYFSIDEQMSLICGKALAIIELVKTDTSKDPAVTTITGSSVIPFIIERNPVQESDIESMSDYPAIMERLSNAESAQGTNVENGSAAGSIQLKNANNSILGDYSSALGKNLKVLSNNAAAIGSNIENQASNCLSIGHDYKNNYGGSLFTVGANNTLCYVVTEDSIVSNVPMTINGDLNINSANHLNVDVINSKATGNSILRMYYDSDSIYKVLVGTVARSVTLLGSSDRPYYANDGDSFASRPIALLSDVETLRKEFEEYVAKHS